MSDYRVQVRRRIGGGWFWRVLTTEMLETSSGVQVLQDRVLVDSEQQRRPDDPRRIHFRLTRRAAVRAGRRYASRFTDIDVQRGQPWEDE